MLKTFAYHKPSEEGLKQINEVREAFSELALMIADYCPDSREKSIANTKIEEAAMWAIKSIVCNDPKSEITK